MNTSSPAAVIFGCAGETLNERERQFFSRVDPLGFILFARNCRTPGQIRALTGDLRDCVGRGDAPILIDQEGGKVARLQPPQWRDAPAARSLGELARRDREKGGEAAYLNARLMAVELTDLGIDVDCAPVLDLPQPDAHDVIGSRAFADDPEMAVFLGRKACEGLLDGGVTPVIKHIPGHGRATCDSHESLPVVEASREELENHDFIPFRELSDMPWAMTAHVVYEAMDPEHPATMSSVVIAEVIRGHMGFDGVLVSDDLSMKALGGDMASRAAAALEAGCDLALHCNGEMDEMEAVAEGARLLLQQSVARVALSQSMNRVVKDFDFKENNDILNRLLSHV
ncbi:MAG: beta-N-acetylhexosaminidase [Alphaproteobacteria bacterium]|nr:beta-N-acetylhexosaminidase [Alphaproteobacteria bacterium]